MRAMTKKTPAVPADIEDLHRTVVQRGEEHYEDPATGYLVFTELVHRYKFERIDPLLALHLALYSIKHPGNVVIAVAMPVVTVHSIGRMWGRKRIVIFLGEIRRMTKRMVQGIRMDLLSKRRMTRIPF